MIDKNGITRINSLYTKFLKRCSENNSKVLYYVTETSPLCNYLHELSQKMVFKIPYPTSLNGIQFEVPDPDLVRPYKAM